MPLDELYLLEKYRERFEAAHCQGFPIKGVMRFTLVFHGNLPATGNKGHPDAVMRIRKQLSEQLEMLWQTDQSLQELRETAYVLNKDAQDSMPLYPEDMSRRELAERHPNLLTSLLHPLDVSGTKYTPLIRQSLNLSCELSILFLKQDETGAVHFNGGDLDGRLKALLDALRAPNKQERKASLDKLGDEAGDFEGDMYCLLQSDTLVERFDVQTERLLFPKSHSPDEAFLIIEVDVRVLRVIPQNVCLL